MKPTKFHEKIKLPGISLNIPKFMTRILQNTH